MPNRMLRDWTKSDKIDALTADAERFFTRLIMKADDYGCYYADSRILKADLFPLKLNSVREADISRWMDECQKAGLIVIYETANKRYLQISDFNQRLRQKTTKFPLPTHDSNMRSDDSNVRSIDSDMRPEVEVEIEVEEKGSNTHPLQNSNLFRKPNIPTYEQVEQKFLMSGGTKEMAKKFYDSNESVGWYYRGSPITNFSNLVGGYINSWKNSGKPQFVKEDVQETGKGTGALAFMQQIEREARKAK